MYIPDINRADRRRLCRLLAGLGYEEQARILYLERTSAEIANHHKYVKPCGDIPSLIAGLSEQFFECVQDTAVSFEALFCKKDPSLFALFLSWASKEIDQFVKQACAYVMVLE